MKPLTNREVEAIMYVLQGKKLEGAGKLMRCSVRTVRFHLDNARRKLGAVNLPHLVGIFMAMQQQETAA